MEKPYSSGSQKRKTEASAGAVSSLLSTKSIGKIRSSKWIQWFETIAGGLLVAYLFFLFLGIPTRMPDQGMEHRLYKGEILWINKFAVGGRLPFVRFTHPFGNSDTSKLLRPLRIPAGANLKRGDIIAFNAPEKDPRTLPSSPVIISRLIGLPGDTVRIYFRRVYVNGSIMNADSQLVFNFKIGFENDSLAREILQKFYFLDTLRDGKNWIVKTTRNTALKMAGEPGVNSLDAVMYQKPGDPALFPYDKKFPFSLDDYGPVIVPQKGDSIVLSATNLPFYKALISLETGDSVFARHDSVFLANSYLPRYRFRENYYWVLGDNRQQALDSRNWGFIPRMNLLGKVSVLWK